jgi:hypothetical protein
VLTCCYAYEQETFAEDDNADAATDEYHHYKVQLDGFDICSEICYEKTYHIDSNDNGNSVLETIEPMAGTRA